MNVESIVQSVDMQTILNAIPGNYLILLPDAPRFTIFGVTDSLLQTTYKTRDNVIGRTLFEVFPDDTTNDEATGVLNLRSSLEYVIARKETHQMADQRYDIENPETGTFEVKAWAASNTSPSLGPGFVARIDRARWLDTALLPPSKCLRRSCRGPHA